MLIPLDIITRIYLKWKLFDVSERTVFIGAIIQIEITKIL